MTFQGKPTTHFPEIGVPIRNSRQNTLAGTQLPIPKHIPAGTAAAVATQFVADMKTLQTLNDTFTNQQAEWEFPTGVTEAMQAALEETHYVWTQTGGKGPLIKAHIEWYSYVWGCPEYSTQIRYLQKGIAQWGVLRSAYTKFEG